MDERQKQLYDEWVDYLNFETMGEKTTIAFCKLKNGFEIVDVFKK